MNAKQSSTEVTRIIPKNGNEKLEGFYLAPPLLSEISEKLGRSILLINFVTDINGVIATKNDKGYFVPPRQITNPYDWRLFQELAAQADALITSGKYLTGFAKGRTTQNFLTQFESSGKFSQLGNWRLKKGYGKISPDIVVPSRSLNITIPDVLVKSKRKILIYTMGSMISSPEAKFLRGSGANLEIIEAGTTDGTGVDGKAMTSNLESKGYRVIKIITGPSVLQILLDANVIDRIYITQVQRSVSETNPENFKKVLAGGGKVEDLAGFTLVQKYEQIGVKVDDGERVNQHFLIFESDKFKAERENHNIRI